MWSEQRVSSISCRPVASPGSPFDALCSLKARAPERTTAKGSGFPFPQSDPQNPEPTNSTVPIS